ncbi:putative myosin light chain kinase DDB_G0282429 [Brevipalpus obovatus]|uniref:putative myosin light chain kinase DDB_G0282429 n=1 Tax=Brevipalpus obovatus TaxID=246614 RepID=UPI003D9F68CF
MAEGEAQEGVMDRDPNELSARVRSIMQNSGAKKINDEEYLSTRLNYKILRDQKIGGGKFGTYYKAKNANGEEMAVKVGTIASLELKRKKALEKSVNILRYIADQPWDNITKVVDIFMTKEKIYIFCEPLVGDLEAYCKKKKSSEDEMKPWVMNVLAAMSYMYESGIGHRTLTPANMALTDGKVVKLTGFTYSMLTWHPDNMQPILAEKEKDYHHHYAPEVIKGEYDAHAADVWALGVAMVNLLTKKHAFDNKTKDHNQVLKSHLRRSDAKISEELECFLGRCLSKDVSDRGSINDLLSHHWVTGEAEAGAQKSATGAEETKSAPQ